MLLAIRWADSSVLLLAGAAVGWYAASLVASEALAGGQLATRRRTLGHWLPILTMSVVAVLLRRPEVALGILFATSVAALSLVLGIVTCTHNFSLPSSAAGGFPVIEPLILADHFASPTLQSASPDRRLWAFVLPAALIALLAGFRGQLTLVHALVLLIQGLAVLFVWRGQVGPASIPLDDGLQRGATTRAVELLLALSVALIASLAGARAATEINRTLGLVNGGFVAALMLSPALVLPMIGSGMNLARAGFYNSAVTMSVGVTLLNLCLALPLVIVLWHSRPIWQHQVEHIAMMASSPRITVATTAPATTPADSSDAQPQPVADDASNNSITSPSPLRYPLPVWRIDTVILILLGLVLLPLSICRWLPGRFEGILMILVYVVYMGLTTMAARA